MADSKSNFGRSGFSCNPTTKSGRKMSLKAICARRRAVNWHASERKGKQVKSLNRLLVLSSQRKSVYCANCLGLLPAAVVANMSATQVFNMIARGDVYEYKPEKGGAK